MWRLVLRMTVLILISMVMYSHQSQDNLETGGRSGHGRQKRSVIKETRKAWEKCIVPYIFFGAYQDNIYTTNIGFALRLYEKYTGFRFQQYAAGATLGDNSQWNLPHSSYANFIQASSCSSPLGRSNGARTVKPCGGYTAVHEIGHLLGLNHEQDNSQSIGSTLFHEENIPTGSLKLFQYLSSFYTYNFNSTTYDPNAFMHYSEKAFSKNKATAITLLDEVDDGYLLKNSQNWYYNFRDIQMFSGCLAEYDCSAAPNCESDGYRSIVNNVCTCICPKGLDPGTGCTTKASIETQTNYPSGMYSLLKPLGGTCPSEFSDGSMTQYAKNSKVNRPTGSYQYISPGYTAGKLVLDVCTKDSASGSGDWPPGEYCILRVGGSCPTGFEEGYIKAEGQQSVTENTGLLPDGTHDQIFEFNFCCRNDFDYREEIDLPLDGTFILYRSGNGCQQVKDHYVVQSQYTFQPTENIVKTGSYPTLNDNLSGTHYYTFYCVYFPLNNDDCGAIKTLTTTDTDYTFISPGFASGSFPPKKDCIWHITSPEGTTMQLDFNEFTVSPSTGGSCTSYIVVKNWQPGFSKGIQICGDRYQKTIWTKYNTLSVEFITGPDQESYKGFNLTVKVIQDKDKCYIGDGSGGQYSGTVNYARDFMPCLPWSEVSHCFYNKFNSVTFGDDLESNYCRTTGYAPKPWCYVEAETCQTQTCDACMTGSCYDVFDDCPARISEDSSFCTKNELGEAQRGCMVSCNHCATHVPKTTVGSGDIKCVTPLAITGVNMTPVKTTYNVGETVDYYCEVNGLTMTRTCTSEGTWTNQKLVCGICPNGWSVFDKRCYNWLGIYATYNVSYAQSVCESMGGTLPRVEDQTRNDNLKKLVHLVHWDAGYSWLGLKKTDGVWKWVDGSPVDWTNWASRQPRSGDCAEMKADGTWATVGCGLSNEHYVVCEIEPSDGNNATACDDSMNDCRTFLASNPTACEDHGDFAWHSCRRTCARGVCATSTVCSDTVSLDVTGSRTYPTSSQIPQGNYVEYDCNSGYYHTSGDLKRICQLDGTFSGTAPVCSDAANTNSVLLTPHYALRWRDNFANQKRIVTTTGDIMKISVPGKVSEWRYYSHMEGTIAFVILRETAANTYQIIGKNVITQTPAGRKTIYQVPTEEQITVQVNDLIGLYAMDNVLSFTLCSTTDDPGNSGWIKSPSKSNTGAITVSAELQFSDLNACRMYSVQAVINPTA